MNTRKSGFERARERDALIAQATRHRADRGLVLEDAGVSWQCERGHAWDDAQSAAQNVRCMNCASQRRELQTERLHALAEERGGRLLSAAYLDASTPLAWECAFGHRWNATADVVARRWCVECVRRRVYDGATACRSEESTGRG
jgi:hypothetical protein